MDRLWRPCRSTGIRARANRASRPETFDIGAYEFAGSQAGSTK